MPRWHLICSLLACLFLPHRLGHLALPVAGRLRGGRCQVCQGQDRCCGSAGQPAGRCVCVCRLLVWPRTGCCLGGRMDCPVRLQAACRLMPCCTRHALSTWSACLQMRMPLPLRARWPTACSTAATSPPASRPSPPSPRWRRVRSAAGPRCLHYPMLASSCWYLAILHHFLYQYSTAALPSRTVH